MAEIGGITPRTMPPVGCSTRSAGFILKMGEGVVTTAAPLLAAMVGKIEERARPRTFAGCFPGGLHRPRTPDRPGDSLAYVSQSEKVNPSLFYPEATLASFT